MNGNEIEIEIENWRGGIETLFEIRGRPEKTVLDLKEMMTMVFLSLFLDLDLRRNWPMMLETVVLSMNV